VQEHVRLPRSGVFEACGDTLPDVILTTGIERLFTADPEAPVPFGLRLVVELRQEQGAERLERIRSQCEVLRQILVTVPERCLQIIRVSPDLGRSTLAKNVVGPLARRRPRPDVDVAGLEPGFLDAYEELLVAVGPHAHVAARQELQLLLELSEVGGCLLRTAQLLARLLRLADDYALDRIVRRLLTVSKDHDIDRRQPPAPCGRPVAGAYGRAVEAVGLDELPENLLDQSVLGSRPDRCAGQEINQRFGAGILRGAVVLGDPAFGLFIHGSGFPYAVDCDPGLCRMRESATLAPGRANRCAD